GPTTQLGKWLRQRLEAKDAGLGKQSGYGPSKLTVVCAAIYDRHHGPRPQARQGPIRRVLQPYDIQTESMQRLPYRAPNQALQHSHMSSSPLHQPVELRWILKGRQTTATPPRNAHQAQFLEKGGDVE